MSSWPRRVCRLAAVLVTHFRTYYHEVPQSRQSNPWGTVELVSGQPMFLFICHASEDKGFVRPLAEELRKEYEKVWYDEYELKLGDNLLEKIDQGLASCDYGIVVLSQAFFKKKKWAHAELEGLIGREMQSGKIILPIWKDVTVQEVRAHSPILAAKFAVSTRAGLAEVLNQIRLAVGVSERQRELTATDAAAQRIQKLRQTIAGKRRAESLLRSNEGTDLINKSIQHLWEILQKLLSADVDPSAPIQFRCWKPAPNSMYVGTVHGLHLNLHPTSLYSADARLEINIFQQSSDHFEHSESNPIALFETEFRPTFPSGDQVVWLDADKSVAYTAEQLGAYLIQLFAEQIEDFESSRD